jgi:hypothetical protein
MTRDADEEPVQRGPLVAGRHEAVLRKIVSMRKSARTVRAIVVLGLPGLISKALAKRIDEVASGARPQPKSLAELQR